jgi:hypothetical protein
VAYGDGAFLETLARSLSPVGDLLAGLKPNGNAAYPSPVIIVIVMNGAEPHAPSLSASPVSALMPLRDVEDAAMKAATDTPVSVKRLATLAGYSYGSYFREAVRALVDRGLLVRVTGGVRRTLQTNEGSK